MRPTRCQLRHRSDAPTRTSKRHLKNTTFGGKKFRGGRFELPTKGLLHEAALQSPALPLSYPRRLMSCWKKSLLKQKIRQYRRGFLQNDVKAEASCIRSKNAVSFSFICLVPYNNVRFLRIFFSKSGPYGAVLFTFSFLCVCVQKAKQKTAIFTCFWTNGVISKT